MKNCWLGLGIQGDELRLRITKEARVLDCLLNVKQIGLFRDFGDRGLEIVLKPRIYVVRIGDRTQSSPKVRMSRK